MEGKIIEKKKKNKKSFSVFFVTINTNKTLNDADLQGFIGDIRAIFKDNLFGILWDRNKAFSPDLIDEYSVKYNIERGDIKERDHAHVLIELTHHGHLAVDLVPIRAYFKKKYGTNFYVNVVPRGNTTKQMEQYVYKKL